MSRTVNILLICLAATLLVSGCNKQDKKKIDTSNIQETAPGLSAVPEAEQRDISEEEAAVLRNEQMREDLRTELLAMLPEFTFTYDATADSFNGSGLPEEGVSLPPLIEKLEQRVKKLQSNPGSAEYQQLIRVMLTQFKSAGMAAQNPAADDAGGTQSASRSTERPPADEFGLRRATKAYGEWRSIREEGENYVIEHNEDYFKQLIVIYGKEAMFSTFAKGQRIKHDEFEYRFDPNSAELLLTALDGRYTMRLYCYTRDSEPGLLYVKQQSGNPYTVYEKLGRGEEPLTEEEKQAFLDLQKEISGAGGSAKAENK